MKLQHSNTVKVLAFPCNQFGAQEPGSNDDIKRFAMGTGLKVNTDASSFLLMDKVDVNGPATHPVWKFLKEASGDMGDVAWNFYTKFRIRCGASTCDVTRHNDFPTCSSLTAKGGEL